jgi:hypothetical protein
MELDEIDQRYVPGSAATPAPVAEVAA